jgi:diguanylate cyclase (GGDEF)-like protein
MIERLRIRDNVLDKLQDEEGRLAALDRYSILDTQPEAQFDKITALVRTVLNVPMAAVTLISSNRQWIKSRQGIDVTETPRDVSFCTHTIKISGPMVVPDAAVHPLFADNPGVTGAPFIRSYLGIPLASPDGYNIGALCAVDTKPRQFDTSQIQIMVNLAALVMDEMELRLIAQTDFLTGALTRRAFIAELDRAWGRFARQNEPSAVLLLDLDRFKSINDSLGHAAGDAVLIVVANCCRDQIRGGDAFGRIGGEEFAILLGNVNAAEAVAAAERFRSSIASLKIALFPDLRVTASIGVASLTTDVTSMQAWLARADAAMYAAKESGRNRCCVAEAGSEVQG